jgi:hypothetical protein
MNQIHEARCIYFCQLCWPVPNIPKQNVLKTVVDAITYTFILKHTPVPLPIPGILAFGDLVGLLGSRETDLSLLVEVWATDILYWS